MILDRLDACDRYSALHPGFAAGWEYLRATDFTALEDGRYPIDGERLFVIVARTPGRGQAAARLEAHRKFIDLQLCVEGSEVIGWRPTSECRQVETPYSEERDILFFAEKSAAWVAVPPGSVAVFFPDDAHAPLAGEGPLLKAVIKVAVDW